MSPDRYMIGEPNTSGWRETREGLVLGEWLCSGCCKPIADGPCDCEREAVAAIGRHLTYKELIA